MKDYWNGSKSLTNTIIITLIAGSIIATIIPCLLLFSVGFIFKLSAATLSFILFMYLVLFNPYYIFSWVSIWRSSKSENNRFYSIIARAFVIIHVSFVVYMMFGIPEIIQIIAKET